MLIVIVASVAFLAGFFVAFLCFADAPLVIEDEDYLERMRREFR